MATPPEPDTELLLAAAARGDGDARGRLLDRHRRRLKHMVVVRLDRRLAARLDPSDVVQETLADAAARLDAYLRERPMRFYPWLRKLTDSRTRRQNALLHCFGQGSVGADQGSARCFQAGLQCPGPTPNRKGLQYLRNEALPLLGKPDG